MENKVIRKLIIIFSIILIICIIMFIIILSNYNKLENDVSAKNEINVTEQPETISVQEQKEKQHIVQECVAKYINTLNINNTANYTYDENGGQIKLFDENKIILNLLSTTYIEENNITKDNVEKFIKKFDDKVLFVPLETTYIKNSNLFKYAVKGYIIDLQYNVLQNDVYLIVNLDMDNSTFSIEPVAEADSIQNVVLDMEKLQSINGNEDNSIDNVIVTEENISNDYLNNFKKMMLSSPEIAFNLLDTDYRTNKFGSIDEFEKYIVYNKDRILAVTLRQYLVNENEDYIQYVCVDQNGKYYIFSEYSATSYNVILDTYTIDLPEFTEQYSKANSSEKAGLNVQKVIDSLNDKDYKYAYSKLDETFKQNNFKTLKDFEDYWNKNLYEQNDIEVTGYQNSGDLHIYTVTIKDKNNAASQAITKNFIVKLTDGTNFVMSFNV